MFDLEGLEGARDVVARHMLPTPQYRWPGLCSLAGCEVWLKHENHTPIGAFKVRGGLVLMDELQNGPGLPRKIITATRGNHGQSIPFAACRLGVPVTVYAPRGNSVEKNAAMTGWGAELIEFGDDFEESRLEAVRVAEAEGAMIVPPFHHALVRGVATYALELFNAVSGLDTVYVPIGMGSGICGVIHVRDLLGLKAEVVGVVASNAAAVARSLEAGRVVATDSADTFADGMACRVPMEEPLAIMRAGAARIVEVSEEEIAASVRMLYRNTHNIAEGAGAAAFAALMQERDRLRGRRAAAILTGGNVDAEVLQKVLAGDQVSPA